jgi:hypothetical protein
LNRSLILLLCAASLVVQAQTRKRNFRQRELGFFGGGSYYIGDINTRRHILESHPAGGIYFRYETNYRYAFRFGVSHGSISGNDATSGEPDQVERNINFRTNITDVHALAEFNFVEYRISNDRYRFTFFIFAGLAGYYFNPKSDLGNGNGYVAMRPYHIEGKNYPKLQISVPFGVGIKWNVAEKVGMGLEWGPRRTFTDYLDDVSGPYPEMSNTDGGIIDRTTNSSAVPGAMRGNPTTRDWYFYYGLTLNFKLPDPHRACHTTN